MSSEIQRDYTQLDIAEIRKILPHRYPFLFVDRVEKMEISDQSPVGDRIIAYKGVTQNEEFFQGHFPDYPVMPGVLIIEALAQTAALMVYRYVPGCKEDYHIYLTGVDEAKFRKPVLPGDLLKLQTQVKKIAMKKLWIIEAKAYVVKDKTEELVCEAMLSSILTPKQKRKNS